MDINLTEQQAIFLGDILQNTWQNSNEIQRIQIGLILKEIDLKLQELKLRRITKG